MDNTSSSNKSQALPPGSVLTVNAARTRGTKFLLNQMLFEKQQESRTQSLSVQPSPPGYACSPVTRFIKIVPPVEPPENCNVVLPKKKKKKKSILDTQKVIDENAVQIVEADEEEAGEKENSEEFNNSLFLPYGRRKKRKRKRKKKDPIISATYDDECDGLTPVMDQSREIIDAEADTKLENVESKKQNKETRQPSYHESKDTKGKNKSTKHIPDKNFSQKIVKGNQPEASTSKRIPLANIVPEASSQNSSESLSSSTPSSIVLSSDTPPLDQVELRSSISEQSTGTQTQAIFQNKGYQGHSKVSSPEVLVYCSDSESDEPKVLCESSVKTPKQNLEGKRITRKQTDESQPANKEIKIAAKNPDRNIITVNVGEESSPEELQLTSLVTNKKIAKKVNTKHITNKEDVNTPNMKPPSERLSRKVTKGNVNTPSQALHFFPEISPCSEAELSPHLPLSQATDFMTPRNKLKSTKLSLSQKKRMSDDALSQDSGSPALCSNKRKLQIAEHISEGFEVHPAHNSKGKGAYKKSKVRFCDDDGDNCEINVPKLTFGEHLDDDVSSMSLLRTISEAKKGISIAFQPKHTSTQNKDEEPSVSEVCKQSKNRKKHPPNIIPETSESSVSSSEPTSSSSGFEVHKENNEKNKNTQSNKSIRMNLRSVTETSTQNHPVKVLCDSTSTEEDSLVKNSSESSEFSRASENPSTDSSASTEMLRPVGKTCLQSIAYVLQTHFGGTLTESFNVMHRNSFNLLTTIMELQALHPEVEEALFGDEEEEEPISE